MTRSTTPNLTKTDLRALADRAQVVSEGASDSDARIYAEAVEDVLRAIVGDARPTDRLTVATGGGLI